MRFSRDFIVQAPIEDCSPRQNDTMNNSVVNISGTRIITFRGEAQSFTVRRKHFFQECSCLYIRKVSDLFISATQVFISFRSSKQISCRSFSLSVIPHVENLSICALEVLLLSLILEFK